MKNMVEKAQTDEKWATTSGMDPELHPEYVDLAEPVKPIIKEMAKKEWGDHAENRAIGWLLTSELGETDKVTQETLKIAGYEPTGEYVDGEAVYRLKESKIKEFKSFVMSGGAKGSDSAWAKAASDVGIPTIHYTFGQHHKNIKAPGFKRILSLSELEAVNEDIDTANKSLNRKIGNLNDNNKNLIRRNAYQVRFSDAVYGVGELSGDAKTVKGGTGWAAQMGIDQGKPVHIFDQKIGKWYSWNKAANRFTMRSDPPPRPPAKFAGIGTRNLNNAGKKAINDLMGTYWAPTTTATSKVSSSSKKRLKWLRYQNDYVKLMMKSQKLSKKLIISMMN